MKTWRIEFTAKELAEIYYALQYAQTNAVVQGDKLRHLRWRNELRKIQTKILDHGVEI